MDPDAILDAFLGTGLGATALRLLTIAAYSPQPCYLPPSPLGRRFGLAPSTVAHALAACVAAGFLEAGGDKHAYRVVADPARWAFPASRYRAAAKPALAARPGEVRRGCRMARTGLSNGSTNLSNGSTNPAATGPTRYRMARTDLSNGSTNLSNGSINRGGRPDLSNHSIKTRVGADLSNGSINPAERLDENGRLHACARELAVDDDEEEKRATTTTRTHAHACEVGPPPRRAIVPPADYAACVADLQALARALWDDGVAAWVAAFAECQTSTFDHPALRAALVHGAHARDNLGLTVRPDKWLVKQYQQFHGRAIPPDPVAPRPREKPPTPKEQERAAARARRQEKYRAHDDGIPF